MTQIAFSLIIGIISFFISIVVFFCKRPLLCDFALIWAYIGIEVCSAKYGMDGIHCALIGFAVAILAIVLMVKVKYVGWIGIAIFGVLWGYMWYGEVMGMFKNSLPQVAPFISGFVGFAIFLYHTYYGVVQGRAVFGEPLNFFSPFIMLWNKITRKDVGGEEFYKHFVEINTDDKQSE